MKPSVGRIVLYWIHKADGITARPAIVTDIARDGVNLHVFFEPNDNQADTHRGNVEENVLITPKIGTWSWPPRV